MVDPKEAGIRFYKGYFDFRGRSTRAEFWWPQLGIFMVVAVAGVLLNLLGTDPSTDPIGPLELIILAPLSIFILAVLIPNIAVLVRRFHDINRSGLLVIPIYIVGVIPVIGFLSVIAFTIVACIEGDAGPNRYGNPSAPFL